MLKNYLKIAWRSLARNRLYSIVNIGGLTIGIASCILIGLYLSNELSYDRFHKNADRLVRVTTEYTVNGAVSRVGQTGSMAGPRLTSAFPEIASYVRIQSFQPYVVRYGDKTFVEPRFLFADSTFFTMLTFPLVEGDPRTALDAPDKIVISRSMEKKYFGDEQAMGKLLRIGGTTDYIVSGVASDAPANSQIQFDFVASYASLANANRPNWSIEVYTTYFLLRDPKDITGLEAAIPAYMKDQKDLNLAPGDYLTYHLEPLTRVHLYSSLQGLGPNGNITYIYILGAIALLILCIACVNYTNLATAQSIRRMPEIGIRKVMGSRSWQLFWQFIGESLLLNFVAFILAIWTAILLLPLFDRLVERPLNTSYLGNPRIIGGMLLLYLVISFASGAYPALLLSRLQLMKVLKTGFSFSGSTGMLRKSLIVFQFMVSVFLIISTVIIFQQLSYLQHKDLGYDKDHVIVLPVDAVIRDKWRSVKEAIQRIPNVESVSCGAEETTYIHWDDELTTAASPGATPMYITASPTDIDFVRTMGLHIIAGSDFTQSDWLQADSVTNPSDPHTSYMLNESAVKALGWTPEQAIGRTVYRSGGKGLVKAVVRDFHYAPLHQAIGPLVIFLDAQYRHIFQTFVKVNGRDIPGTLRELEATWKQRVPHRPFQYHFLDDTYNVIYHTEQQTAAIFSTFSTLAILLACLGLFALAAYSTVQRAKEIGIRKVLGAGVVQIVLLISGDFVKLVALASLIAFPIAWLMMKSWLRQFAYRIDIGWWVFGAAGLVAVVIALFTIGLQAVRAANASLVKSLRSE
ncbi:MAG TPA: FtsX-like permease family protein [Puia sp.]|nr:FtsX-like permease family protein [Puia sp.]